MASTAARVPSISASTVPSGRFRAQPATPRLSASCCIEPRNHTPCTRPWMWRWARTRSPPSAIEQPDEGLLVEDLDAELLRLGELGAGIGADHQEVRLLADAADHPTAERLDSSEGFRARHALEPTGEHQLLSGELPLVPDDGRRLHPRVEQAFDHRAVLLLRE